MVALDYAPTPYQGHLQTSEVLQTLGYAGLRLTLLVGLLMLVLRWNAWRGWLPTLTAARRDAKHGQLLVYEEVYAQGGESQDPQELKKLELLPTSSLPFRINGVPVKDWVVLSQVAVADVYAAQPKAPAA